MKSCELCGAPEARYTNQIEGAQVRVCKRCSSSGRIIEEDQVLQQPPYSVSSPQHSHSPEPEPILEIRHDFASVFLTERNKRRMTQEQFAQFLNIKQSMAASFETGAHKPSLGLAQKLEKILKVPLLESVSTTSEFEISKKPSGTGGMTLGHFINIKNKKN